MRFLIILGVLLALLSPAYAQSCQFTMDQALGELQGTEVLVIDEPDAVTALMESLSAAMPSIPADLPVTRILIAIIQEQPAFGLEVGGCLSPPLLWPAGLAYPLTLPSAMRLSGKTPYGIWA